MKTVITLFTLLLTGYFLLGSATYAAEQSKRSISKESSATMKWKDMESRSGMRQKSAAGGTDNKVMTADYTVGMVIQSGKWVIGNTKTATQKTRIDSGLIDSPTKIVAAFWMHHSYFEVTPSSFGPASSWICSLDGNSQNYWNCNYLGPLPITAGQWILDVEISVKIIGGVPGGVAWAEHQICTNVYTVSGLNQSPNNIFCKHMRIFRQ